MVLLLAFALFLDGHFPTYTTAGLPACPGADTARIVLDTTTGEIKRCNGTSWVVVGDGTGGSPAWGSITGTLANQTDLQTALDGKEASGTFSGVGACAANQWASTLVDNTAPTCTQPAFSNLSGAATDAQVPNTITVDLATLATTATTANAGDSATAFFSAGTVETARLGSGTADSTTYLRGDQTWATPAGGSGPTVVRVTVDVADTTITTWQDVTGLTKAVTSGVTYSFACFLTYTTAATTTALQLSLNGPTVTALDYGVEMSTTATARHNSAQTAYDTVVNPATGGGSTRLPATIHGSIIPSANGTLAVRMRTEVDTSAATVKRGSWCEFHQL